jgi:hypothetical protein
MWLCVHVRFCPGCDGEYFKMDPVGPWKPVSSHYICPHRDNQKVKVHEGHLDVSREPEDPGSWRCLMFLLIH